MDNRKEREMETSTNNYSIDTLAEAILNAVRRSIREEGGKEEDDG